MNLPSRYPRRSQSSSIYTSRVFSNSSEDCPMEDPPSLEPRTTNPSRYLLLERRNSSSRSSLNSYPTNTTAMITFPCQDLHHNSTTSNSSSQHITDLNETNEDNVSISLSTNESNEELDDLNKMPLLKCRNCQRKQSKYLIDTYGPLYMIQFHQVSSELVKKKCKFKHITISSDEIVELSLCHQCAQHLTCDNFKERNDSRNTWTGFIWNTLKDPCIQQNYGDYIWRFIPEVWRYWWIESAQNIMIDITVEEPSCFFVDRTAQIKDFDDSINSYSLPRLRDACNQYLIPNVLCPFGCSEFGFKSGFISIDIVFQRYLPKCNLKLMNNSKAFKYIEYSRDDYIRREGDYDEWILNPKWKIRPSISFKNNTPFILTCHDHDKGTKLCMIHPCRQPSTHNLPSKYSDQLTHCCIRSRTVKPMKHSTYSTGFQMHEQRGTFNGIDTCNVTSYRNFSFRSKLLSDAESRSLHHRPDINSLLSQLVDEKEVSNFIANEKRNHARNVCQNVDFKRYFYGATYVPVEAAMMLQQDMINNTCTVIKENEGRNEFGDPVPNFTLTCTKYWPSVLYPCQKMDSYGAMFSMFPCYKSRGSAINTSVIWIMSALLTSIQKLWSSVQNTELRSSNWHGWFLVYLTKHCFSNVNQRPSKVEVFKYNQVGTIERLHEKLGTDMLSEVFVDIEQVLFIDLMRNDGNDTLEQQLSEQNIDVLMIKDVLIIHPFYINADGPVEERLVLHDITFELRVICRTWSLGGNKWDGEVYSRHGEMYQSWWYQKRNNSLPCHSEMTLDSLDDEHAYVLAYVKVTDIDIESLRNKFLKYLGGQSHVKCEEHRLCLISSLDRKNKCHCGRHEYLRCASFDCKVNICKKCFDRLDDESVTYINNETSNQVNDDVDDENNDDASSLIEPYDLFREEGAVTESDENDITHSDELLDDKDALRLQLLPPTTEDLLLERDDFDNYVTTSNDPDLPLEEDETEIGDDIDNHGILDMYQSSNAGEYILDTTEDNQNKGTFNDVTISGHTILNQCGSLLSRKKHEVKGSLKQKFFLQKICSTSIGASIPLLYPEAMLFPSIFWKSADDNCSIIGAIPSSLLSSSISSHGFASIPSHIRSRLTSPTSSTSTDY